MADIIYPKGTKLQHKESGQGRDKDPKSPTYGQVITYDPATNPMTSIAEGKTAYDTEKWTVVGGSATGIDLHTGKQFVAADTAAISKPPMYEPPPPADTGGLQQQIETQRKALEDSYQKEQERIKAQREEAQRKEEEWRSKQEETMAEAKPLTSPFREDIEKNDRERLKVEENFFQNQALTNELDQLLTESNEMTRRLQTQKVPGLAGLQQSGRMIKAQENVQARVSVINAVMAARNNQIGTALNFIDRTVGAITQDRQDRLSYLNTLFNWYETQRTEEGTKIFNLTKDEKDIINKQIGLLEDDLARTQAVSDKIKEIMITNPDLASESGISLSDTLEGITKKMSTVVYAREVRSERDEMGKDGYLQIVQEEAARKPAEEVATRTDSKGVERYYWKPTPAKEYASPEAYKIWQLAGGKEGTGLGFGQWYIDVYKGGEGGISTDTISDYADLIETGQMTIQNIPTKIRNQVISEVNKRAKEATIPKDFTDEELRQAARDEKSQNKPYTQVIDDIDSNLLIKNKDMAKLIASEIYGKKDQKQGLWSKIWGTPAKVKANQEKRAEEARKSEEERKRKKEETEKYYSDLNQQILDWNKKFLGQ